MLSQADMQVCLPKFPYEPFGAVPKSLFRAKASTKHPESPSDCWTKQNECLPLVLQFLRFCGSTVRPLPLKFSAFAVAEAQKRLGRGLRRGLRPRKKLKTRKDQEEAQAQKKLGKAPKPRQCPEDASCPEKVGKRPRSLEKAQKRPEVQKRLGRGPEAQKKFRRGLRPRKG